MAPPVATRQFTINLPPLHSGRGGTGGQVEIDQSDARFQVVICGRRWGKTTYGVRKCLKGAIETGGVYWWIAPIYPVAMIGWRMLKRVATQIPGTEIREADRCVIIPNGGSIWIKSADNPDSLRGEKVAGAVFDEAAYIKEDAWFEAVRPALMDSHGWALFIGTPNGRNWIYRLYNQAGHRKDWARWRKPTWDNPYVDPAEIEEARLEMSENQYKQEIEADFGASTYLVFPELDPLIHEWRGPLPDFVACWGGADFGGDSVGNHKSACAVAGETAADELIVWRVFKESGAHIGERQMDYMIESDIISVRMGLRSRTHNMKVRWRADKSQMWGISLAQSMGLHITKSKGGPDSVLDGIELIHRRLKPRFVSSGQPRPKLFYLPECRQLQLDLEKYHYPEPNDDKATPNNPVKVDDDLIDAFRYMVEGKDRAVIGDPSQLYAGQLGRLRNG